MTKFQESNDKRIQELLEQGEELIWSGTSEVFPLKTKESTKPLFIRWGICVVCVCLWMVFFFVFLKAPDTSVPSLTLSLVLVIIFFAYLAMQPSFDRKKILGKNSYYLTNHRAFVLDGSDKPYAVNLYGMTSDFFPSEDGCTTLLLHNSSVSKKPKNLRNVAWKPLDDQYADQGITDMAFYHIKDDELLHKAFQ